jgi:hypothetical protein
MHFVPFPARSASNRFAGSGVGGNHRIGSEQDALGVAATAVRSRGIDPSQASVASIDHDQWTVAGEFDSDRPLYRVAVNDDAGTEIYISSATGDVVLFTTQNVRLANYFGSIAHWIYPTVLRHHARVWSALMWWLSLLATIGASLGVIIGIVRLGTGAAYRGLQRWHHILGLILAPFILCWIFSGFLSMDSGWPVDLSRKLHTFDFTPLTSHPWLRSSLVLALCLCGLAFSLTGVVLAWRRLSMGPPRRSEDVV